MKKIFHLLLFLSLIITSLGYCPDNISSGSFSLPLKESSNFLQNEDVNDDEECSFDPLCVACEINGFVIPGKRKFFFLSLIYYFIYVNTVIIRQDVNMTSDHKVILNTIHNLSNHTYIFPLFPLSNSFIFLSYS